MIRHIIKRGRQGQVPAAPAAVPPVEEIPCRLDEKLTLGQFLKIANLVDSGAEAKMVISDGAVDVNKQTETRRGRGLAAGDEVRFAGRTVRVVEEQP